MDGNNSLKRFKNAGRSDRRIFTSDYFLSEAYVDEFKDEVAAPKKKTGSRAYSPNSDDSDDAAATAADIDADPPLDPDPGPAQAYPTSGAPDSECIHRWRNADPAHTKAMWKAFHESGIFTCACRHGFILIVANMIRSGEL